MSHTTSTPAGFQPYAQTTMATPSSDQPQLLRHTLDELALGEIAKKKEVPRLPQEIMNIILRQVDDPPFLWTTCRNVSQSFRQEVEYIFATTWLRETTVMWPRNPENIAWDDCFNCRLSRLSDDGLTAYFTVHSGTPETIVSLENERSAEFYELKNLITAHIQGSTTLAYMDVFHVVTRIGADTNNTYFTDAPVPGVVMHGATSEISLDWKALFTTAFGEAQQLLNIKAATGCDLTHKRHLDLDYHLSLDYPIVFTDEDLWRDELPDYAPYLKVIDRRGVILGWFSEAESRALPPSYYTIAITSIRCLEGFSSVGLLEEIFARIDGDFGESRGAICWVQDPAQTGWTRHRRNRDRTCDWYNHAWEDPRDGGRTTWSEDPIVMEVEAMARAWEKGLA